MAIVHRWAKLNETKSTKFNIDVSGLQLVFDREVIKGFYKFLITDIISVAKEDQERVKKSKALKLTNSTKGKR